MRVRQIIGLRNQGAVLATTLVFAMMLAGCDAEKTRNLLDQRADEAQKSLTEAREAQPNAKHYNPLVVSDRVWAGNAATRMRRGLPLPARYESAQGITIISGQPLSMHEIASSISAQTGIPVHLVDPSHLPESNTPPPPSPVNGRPGAPAAPGVSTPALSNTGATNNNNNNNSGMLVSYEGPLSGLLERVAGYFSVNWRYDGISISIARFETRVFLIEALPGSATTTDTSQGSASTGSSGGGNSSGSGGGSSGGSSGSSGSSGSGSGGSGSSGGGTITGSLTQNVSYTGSIKYWE